MSKVQFYLIVFATATVQSIFNENFAKFISKNYGEETLSYLNRRDGIDGRVRAFGGCPTDAISLNHRPLLLIHGNGGSAADFDVQRKYFMQKGYNECELYATTYGNGNDSVYQRDNFTCSFSRQIRYMIQAIAQYTHYNKIDVLSYGGGTAIYRKAVLGGLCPDSGEYLGEPLTHLVEVFVSVNGITYGIGKNNSLLRPNGDFFSCESYLMKELNSQHVRYEAAKSFSVRFGRSRSLRCCEKPCGELKNESGDYRYIGNTKSILPITAENQYYFFQVSPHEAANTRANTIMKNTKSSIKLSDHNETQNNKSQLIVPYNWPDRQTFNPKIMIVFVVLPLFYFLFKFLSRCVCDSG